MDGRIRALAFSALLGSSAASAAPWSPRDHLGSRATVRLLESTDADELERGILRAALDDGPDSALALAKTISRDGRARREGRLLIEATRALALLANMETARAALISLLEENDQRLLPPDAPGVRADSDFVIELAARGLARSGDRASVTALAELAEQNEERAELVVRVLREVPLERGDGGAANLLPAELLEHPHVAIAAAAHGDSRAYPRLKAALAVAANPPLRAAILRALGPESVRGAKDGLREPSPLVRAAAAGMLVDQRAESAPGAVVSLLTDTQTVAAGVELAGRFPHVEVARGLIALLQVSSDETVRKMAARALAVQPGEEAKTALRAMALDSQLGATAIEAIGRVSDAESLMVLESLPTFGATARHVARAYWTRQILHGQKSRPLDQVLRRLSKSGLKDERALADGSGIFTEPEMQPTAATVEELYHQARVSHEPSRRRAGLFGLARYAGTGVERELFEQLELSDPDATVRALAKELRLGLPARPVAERVLWITERDVLGEPVRAGRGKVVLEDGPPIPFAFDLDGMALVRVTTKGEPHVELAP